MWSCRSSGNSIRPTREQKNGADSHAAPEGRGCWEIPRKPSDVRERHGVAERKKAAARGVPGRRLGVPTRTREGFAWPPILGKLSFAVLTHGPGSVGSSNAKLDPEVRGSFIRLSLENRRCLFALFLQSADTKARVEDTKKRTGQWGFWPVLCVPYEQGEVFVGVAIQWQRRPITRCSRTASSSQTPGCKKTKLAPGGHE